MKDFIAAIITIVVILFVITLIGEDSRAKYENSGIVNKVSYKLNGDGRYDIPDSTLGNLKLGMIEVGESVIEILDEVIDWYESI